MNDELLQSDVAEYAQAIEKLNEYPFDSEEFWRRYWDIWFRWYFMSYGELETE